MRVGWKCEARDEGGDAAPLVSSLQESAWNVRRSVLFLPSDLRHLPFKNTLLQYPEPFPKHFPFPSRFDIELDSRRVAH